MERGAAPAGRPRKPALGRLRASCRAVLRPLCEVLAGRARRQCRTRKHGPELKRDFKSREMPRWSAERRAGRRHRPVISGEPEIGPTARRATGAAFRTSACRRSAPSRDGERPKGTTAYPAPQRIRAAKLGFFSLLLFCPAPLAKVIALMRTIRRKPSVTRSPQMVTHCIGERGRDSSGRVFRER